MRRRAGKREVLLASDVPYSRSLLRQQMKRMGSEVTATAAVREALAAMHEREFDLLIIDLANPETAGEQLLLQTRINGHTFPILLLLSNLDRDMLRRLANLWPVGFLTKPLNMTSFGELLPLAMDADEQLLRRSVELSRFKPTKQELRAQPGEGSTEDATDQIIAGGKLDEERLGRMLGKLPLLPHVVAGILQLDEDDEEVVHKLSEVISSDPRLSGQLLRIVNSAYFGFARRIATIPEATVVLGTAAIRNLTVGAAVSGFFNGKSELVDRTQLWRHSLAVAIASRKVAEMGGSRRTEEAFTAGLLHDFGRLALERQLGDVYAEALIRAREQSRPLLETEQEVLGLDHAWLGGWLAAKWNLPPLLAEPIGAHHSPEVAAEATREIAAAVNVGDALCHCGELQGIYGVPLSKTPSTYAVGMLNVDMGQAMGLLPQIAAETKALEQQLSAAMPAS